MLNRSWPSLIVAPASPPLTGQSAYFSYLRRVVGLHHCDFTPLIAVDRRDGLSSYLGKYLRAFAIAFAELFSRERPAALLVLDSGVGLIGNILIALALKSRGARLIFSHHSFRYINRASILMKMLCAIGGPSSVHLFLCNSMARKFQRAYNIRNYVILSNARRVAVEELEPITMQPDPRTAALILGYLSNISFEKGIKEAIETAKGIRAAGVDAEIIIAGPAVDDDVERYLRAEIKLNGDCIKWLGRVDGEVKRKFFADIDLLIFPTTYENEAQPNVLFEALRFGVPSISFGRGCIEEDLDGSGSFVITPSDDFIDVAVKFIINTYGVGGVIQHDLIKAKAKSRFDSLCELSFQAEKELIKILINETG